MKNKVKEFLIEFKESILFFIFILIITSFVHKFYVKLIVESYDQQRWDASKKDILLSCQKKIVLDKKFFDWNKLYGVS